MTVDPQDPARARSGPKAHADATQLYRHLARRGALLGVGAALVWPLQAVAIAAVLADLLTGDRGLSPIWAAVGFVVLAGIRAALEMASQAALSRAAEAEIRDRRARTIDGETTAAEPAAIGGPGALAALAVEKTEALRPYMLRYRPARMRVAVLPPLILALAFWHSWAVGLVLLMAGPLIPVFMALVGWAAKTASEEQMVEVGQLNDLLVDRLAALGDLQLLGAGGRVVDSFAAASEDLRRRTMAVLRIAFLSSTVLEFFAAVGVAMVAVWVGFSLLGEIAWGSWGAPITPFAGIYLLLLAPDYFQPLRDLAAAWHDKVAAETVIAELDALEAEDRPRILGRGAPAAPLPGPATITLRGLRMTKGRRVIGYPDLDIPPGTTLAVTGASGAGKTTLLRLLAGLDRTTSGSIDVAGRPLDDDCADAWRARLGWLPQAPHFLNRSLRGNVTFGGPLRPGVIDRAALGDVIAALPRGDLTVLGERGAGLSGGEARRVMLARALQAGADVILADEPTADLDEATADRVAEGLLQAAAGGATLIVATHDPRLAARMEQIVDLGASEDGA
ncbi:MAG: thiol reductant ABC exporter subunit CydD [Marinibacterium sp.]